MIQSINQSNLISISDTIGRWTRTVFFVDNLRGGLTCAQIRNPEMYLDALRDSVRYESLLGTCR